MVLGLRRLNGEAGFSGRNRREEGVLVDCFASPACSGSGAHFTHRRQRLKHDLPFDLGTAGFTSAFGLLLGAWSEFGGNKPLNDFDLACVRLTAVVVECAVQLGVER